MKTRPKQAKPTPVEELAELRREHAVRNLCESMGFKPNTTQLEILAALPDDGLRRKLVHMLPKGVPTLQESKAAMAIAKHRLATDLLE